MAGSYFPGSRGFHLEDHTADIWLVAEGRDIDELMKNALEGLYSVMASEFIIKESVEQSIELSGKNEEEVLIDLLSEALFLFDAESRIITGPEFDVIANNADLRVNIKYTASITEIPEGAHGMEVKAATYHGATMERIGERWRARILLDI